jgi:AAA domain
VSWGRITGSSMAVPSSNLFHIYSPQELKARSKELHSGEFLIEGLIPRQSLSLVIGESGEGKSPFLYQALISVAAGIPIVGHAVKQGKVLYLDCENGLAQVEKLVWTLSEYLGLDQPPSNLRLWNLNDAGEGFGAKGHQLADFVASERSDWVIIDPLKTIFPRIDQDNAVANACYKDLRKLGADFGCAFTSVHHPRKPSNNPDERPENLEVTRNLREWFYQSRGSQELINGCDVRIGLDKARTPGAAVVVRGFGRVDGEFPPILLARDTNAEGKAVGYRTLGGLDQLNPDQLAAFRKLPTTFKFRDAETVYGRKANPTNQFLRKLVNIGLVVHDKPKELYVKVSDGGGGDDGLLLEMSQSETVQVRPLKPTGFIAA